MKIRRKGFIRFVALLTAFVCLTAMFTVIPASAATDKSNIATVNKNANQNVQNILHYLKECNYTQKTVFGAFDYTDYVNESSLKKNGDNNQKIIDTYGVTPALYSVFFKPETEQDAEEIYQRMEDKFNEGAIVMLQPSFSDLHSKYKELKESNDPNIRKKYEDVDLECLCADYDWQNPNRNKEICEERWKDVIKLGDILEELQNRGVSVVCRMYVEMNNPTFHNYNTPDISKRFHFRRIYRQTVDYLLGRGLNNFLIQWCPVGINVSAQYYYPNYDDNMEPIKAGEKYKINGKAYTTRDDYVDIVSPTIYPQGQYDGENTALNSQNYKYEDFLGYGKVFGYSEYGASRTDRESGDWALLADALNQRFTQATFVNTWCGANGFFHPSNINAEKFVYNNRLVVLKRNDAVNPNQTLLPDLYSGVYPNPGDIAFFSKTELKGSLKGLSVGKYSSVQLKKQGISLSSVKSLNLTKGYQIIFYTDDNCKGKTLKLVSNSNDLSHFNLSKYKSLQVVRLELENATLNKKSISSDTDSDSSLINDGTLDYWETYKGKNSWVVIDLENVYSIGRWEVKHASEYGELTDANVVDYRLQYSIDGKKWKDADVVYGNNDNIVTRDFEQVDAQYVRLLIENPNSTVFEADANRAMICELSVFGAKIGNGIETDWTLKPTVIKEPESIITTQETIYQTVEKEEEQPTEETDKVEDKSSQNKKQPAEETFPWLWLVIGGVVVIAGCITVFLVVKTKKK